MEPWAWGAIIIFSLKVYIENTRSAEHPKIIVEKVKYLRAKSSQPHPPPLYYPAKVPGRLTPTSNFLIDKKGILFEITKLYVSPLFAVSDTDYRHPL